ncbi:MAG: hypothetical protein J1E97_04225 [Muribaculaceae bacterium]|nr:hypothetical protein [Muribaculaceae bacterium]
MIATASKYWADLQPYRAERQRCKNYTYGNQWKDIVNVDGRRITEEQYIRSQGSAPLKNNLIRRIVRNVLGVFRNNYRLPAFGELSIPEALKTDRLAERYDHTCTVNNLEEIYARVLEEYLIGGLAVVRKRVGLVDGAPEVLTDIVTPDSFFFNSDATDPRGWDINCIGEIHTVAGPDSPQRIVEIWRRDGDRWHYSFITDDEKVLRSGESPYPGGMHPYVLKAYPFIDGEIHSFVADCIDQQRYINRLITLHDWVIRAGAKGVLLIPEGAVPDDLEIEDIAAQWSIHNGVIRYKARTGMPEPKQVSTTTSNAGITDLLEVQLKMMEDVSGINAALQGQIANGNISGTLYEQQVRHSLTGLADIIEGFRSFIAESAAKDVKILAQL